MDLKSYSQKVKAKEIKINNELRSHLVSYIAVNLGLFLLNMITSPGYPWFIFVVGGWGIGIASHWCERLIAFKNVQDISDINIVNIELKTLIKNHKSRHSFYMHVTSNIAVVIYLLSINIITSPGFLWALIPGIAMAVGIVTHWAKYTSKGISTHAFIKDEIIPTVTNEQLQRAIILKQSITKVIDEIRVKFKYFAADLLPKIDDYVKTIELITIKEEDLNNSLKEVSSQELLNEKQIILDKIEHCESPMLIQEYNNFITEIDNHLKTIKRVTEQRELLQIKITTSINSLKHLNLELVGMKSKTTLEDTSILDEFEKKSSDLTIYYKDLLDSYDELYK